MLKIRKIKLSGFRGIKTPQELFCVKDGETVPTSFVLFGVNSSGKTSFMDGLEWFLSPENKIQWLRREDAQEAAYPHQSAQPGDSYVEIEFFEDGKVTNLRKTFDDSRKTKPVLSDKDEFQRIYQSFVIKPYFRYIEIVEFVLNRTGVEKYQELARWMGFESELNFQERLAKIVSQLEKKKEQIETRRDDTLRAMGQLTRNTVVDDASIIAYCNNLLKSISTPSNGTKIALLTH
ncbi:MAG: AAA family ATPase [Nitrospirae bacterium]|nr:AAA family ATPase [Nitrospirota bacterium]